jgi:hypothetical protein
MKLDKLFEQTESGSAITSSDNFDITPVKFPRMEKSLTSRNRKRKKRRKRKSVEFGPDIYFGGE